MLAARFALAALPSVAAAPPSSFKLIGHPKECSCLDATDVVRQAELETFLAQTPGAPLLPANHDKGERCQRLQNPLPPALSSAAAGRRLSARSRAAREQRLRTEAMGRS